VIFAVYARQSVDKKDSISIETQIDECKRKLGENGKENIQIFSDKGFSGKSTNRPEFQRMMDGVRENRVAKIIVYKLDRISRSLIDFLKIEEELESRSVSFISCKEEFDTSTPMGKMMLHILMVFAEMERETIQKRITDNYYARGEKGLYLGGYAPFGYNKIPAYADGKKTYTYEINPSESEYVKSAYSNYANDDKSLNAIARDWNEAGIPTRKGSTWKGTTVAGILTNPVFVRANADVYNFLKTLKATLNNPIEDYTGKNGCIAYGNAKSRKGAKFKNYENQFVTLGLHEGYIDSDLWLRVQFKFKERSGHTSLGTGNLSWLSGLVKCKCCGLSEYVKHTQKKSRQINSREYKYFYCRNRLAGVCAASRKMISVDFLESEAEKALLARLKECQDITIADTAEDNTRSNLLKIQLGTVDKKIENLIESLADGTEMSMKFINEAIDKFGEEREKISSELLQIGLREAKKEDQFTTAQIITDWKNYDTDAKRKVAGNMIQEIKVNGYDVDIVFY
ncbi:MAG: recombinase family protein, partial [Oscillospiraceae bacterium]|jgi:DNA invertase Pin-like site-specific DNA recombinase|nr:recombinase family protein [Oscillospiraceae bacterium]